MSEWVDLQLAHQLAPVAAPDQLWDRLHRPPRRRGVPRLAVATVGAVVAVAVLAYSSTRRSEVPRFASVPPGSCIQCHL